MIPYTFPAISMGVLVLASLGAGCQRPTVDTHAPPLSRDRSSGDVYTLTIGDGIYFSEGQDFDVVAWSVAAEWNVESDDSGSSVGGWAVPHSAAAIPGDYRGRFSLSHVLTPIGPRRRTGGSAAGAHARNQMVFLGTVVIEIPGGRADTHPRAKAVIRYRLTLCREGTASYEPLAEKYVLLEPGVRIRDVPIVIDAGRPVRTAACETEAR